MYYLYGTKPDELVEAKDTDFAIKKIKMIELYPENQAEPKPFRLDEHGYPVRQENYIDFPGYRDNRFYEIDESLIDKAFVPLYEALAAEKENIIQSYKESRRFREDACKEVAANMSYIDTGYYLYKNMRSKDINKYPDLGKFYSSFLKSSYDDYVKKYGSK